MFEGVTAAGLVHGAMGLFLIEVAIGMIVWFFDRRCTARQIELDIERWSRKQWQIGLSNRIAALEKAIKKPPAKGKKKARKAGKSK